MHRHDVPHAEPLRATLTRTVLIAAAAASAVTAGIMRTQGQAGAPRLWTALFLGSLWITFGGHWPELLFINRLRPLLSRSGAVRVPARILLWLFAGPVLFAAGAATYAIVRNGHVPSAGLLTGALLWGGPMFVGVELVVHAVALVRGRPSFWNGRG